MVDEYQRILRECQEQFAKDEARWRTLRDETLRDAAKWVESATKDTPAAQKIRSLLTEAGATLDTTEGNTAAPPRNTGWLATGVLGRPA